MGTPTVEDLDSTKPGDERRKAWSRPAPTGPAKGAALSAVAVAEPPASPQAAQAAPATASSGSAASGAYAVDYGPAKGADLIPDLPKEEASVRTRKWWVGTLPSCPCSVVHLGGQNFPDYEDPPVEDGSGVPRRAYRKGRVVALTDAQVGKIRDAMRRRMVRRGVGVFMLPEPGKPTPRGQLYRYSPGDEPIAMHVYMVPQDYCGEVLPQAAYWTGVPLGG